MRELILDVWPELAHKLRWRTPSLRRTRTETSQFHPAAAISSGMKSPKKKPTKLRNWRVAIMRARAHGLGIVAAPDQKAAEAEAVRGFGLSEEQRKRLLILERG
jgi:hypothetical protein